MNEIVDNLKVHFITKAPVMMIALFFLCIPVYHSYAGTVHEAGKTMFQQQQQRKKITGHVQNANGDPVVGANVTEKGVFNNGTITNSDGNFTLTVSDNAVIVISYIGYSNQEINTKGRSQVNITLQENIAQMDSVVVTAFAKQKKINVTGAISTISGKEIVSSPVANITNALIGVVPGVNGLQATGEAGRNQTNIKIRGIATYGNSNPLIVIDGVEQAAEQAFVELDAIDPNEILSISVLKDAASTAVYGIRAANGVIIVTTKRGHSGKPKISLSANYGITQASMLQKGLSSYDWAYMRNEAIKNDMNSYDGTSGLAAFLFSDEDLWKLKNNRDFTSEEVANMSQLTDEQKARLNASPALYYGSEDPYKALFGKYGPQAQLNLNISGGTERVKYFTSFGFFNQESITNAVKYYDADTKSSFRRYNFRTNFDINVVKNLTISLNLAGQFGAMQGPGTASDPYDLDGRYFSIMQLVMEGNPIQSTGIRDGRLVSTLAGVRGSAQNPLATIINDSKGGQNTMYYFLNSGAGFIYNNLLDNTLKLDYQMPYVTKGLRLTGTVSYQDNYNKYASINPSLPIYTAQRNLDDPNTIEYFGGSRGNAVFNSYGYSNWNKLYVDAGVNYENAFDKHNIQALVLGKASRYTMPGDDFHTPSGVMGLVGRVAYNYADRYMAEVNMGYNGTEQFAKGHRFGLFPAFSAGWVPTLEKFFPKNNILNFLKIRASYGEVGNDLLGSTGRRYLYLPNTYNLNQGGYWLGTSNGSSPNAYYPGANEGAIGNPDITWEKAKKKDIGVESMFFNSRLSINYDWFFESRSNILTQLGIIPGVYGVPSGDVPPANVGQTENKGYELVVGWKDQVNNFGYAIEGHLTHTKNKVIYKAEAPNPYDWMNETGKAIGQRFGLHSDGFFNTPEELNNRPYNTYTSNKATLGDIRYIDINGDGLIDNKDVAPIGYPNFPEYQFGVKLRANYKGFEISALFNGSKNGSFYMPDGFVIPYILGGGNAWQWMFDGRWTPEKAASGEKITYPRATYNYSYTDNDFLKSDFWMRSTDFFRLKNIEIAYTFIPEGTLIKRLGISSLRVYANGNNIYTFKNDLSDIGIDPETPDARSKYIFPLIRTYNFGCNVQF
ncbi:MAG: TonB-dependent receptor [Agriterribacter sp.]